MATEKTLKKEIFISFSGKKSKVIALALKKWLGSIFREVKFVVSYADIPKGNFWIGNLNNHLRRSIAGILCVTRDNYKEPWLMFEAGALMTKHERGCQAIPFVLDEKPDEIIAFLQNTPLSMVQTTSYRVKSGEKPDDKKLSEAEENRDELCRMVLEIHRASENQEREADLELFLKNHYEYLENALQTIADKYPDEITNPQDTVTQALLEYAEQFERTLAAAMEQDERDKQNKQRQNERLEEIQDTVQSSLLLLGEILSAISDKGSGHEEQFSEFGESLKRMEITLNQSMEVRQRIAFHMGLIHERFPAVLSGLDISSGFAPLDTEFSDYHENAKTYVTQVREEISACLNGNILMSLDSVTESISKAETELNDILEAVKTLLLSKGAVIPDNTRILDKITLSQKSLNEIQKVRQSLLKVRHGEISV